MKPLLSPAVNGALASGSLALIPVLLLLWYVRRPLATEQDPVSTLPWWAFGGGMLASLPVLMVTLPLRRFMTAFADPFSEAVVRAFVTAALPEESFKLVVIAILFSRYWAEMTAQPLAVRRPVGGIVYGAIAALGFACVENFVYIGFDGLSTACVRAFTAVPCHACLGAIMGYYLTMAKLGPHAKLSYAKAWCLPVLLHGLYDLPLMTSRAQLLVSTDDGFGAMLLALMVLAFLAAWARLLFVRMQGFALVPGVPGVPGRAPQE